MTNQELIQKATITTAALANAGKLNPKQSDKFLDFVQDESSMKDVVRMVRFTNEEMLIEKIGVGKRVAVPKEEADDPKIRRGVSTSKIVLKPVEIMVPFEVGDIFKEVNIEGASVEDHVIRMMAAQLANNLEQLYWEGNTVGPAVLEGDIYEGGSTSLYVKDTYLALFNGWLAAAEAGHVVDAQGNSITQQLFGRALRAMPNKFKRNRAALRWLLSSNHEQYYREGLSGRQDALGAAAVNGADSPSPFGVKMFPVSLLTEDPIYAENSVANTDGTTATALKFGPVTDLVITPTTLGKNPEAKYLLGTDYSVNLTAGTWTRLGGGSIGSGATVKVTYKTGGRMLLTDPQNMILAIGRDIRIERDRNIYRTVNEFAITVKAYCTFEETDALVLCKNMAVPE